jgi:hypothetical protein
MGPMLTHGGTFSCGDAYASHGAADARLDALVRRRGDLAREGDGTKREWCRQRPTRRNIHGEPCDGGRGCCRARVPTS